MAINKKIWSGDGIRQAYMDWTEAKEAWDADLCEAFDVSGAKWEDVISERRAKWAEAEKAWGLALDAPVCWPCRKASGRLMAKELTAGGEARRLRLLSREAHRRMTECLEERRRARSASATAAFREAESVWRAASKRYSDHMFRTGVRARAKEGEL